MEQNVAEALPADLQTLVGARFKVKRDYITKDYGIRVHSPISGDHNKAWPGEVGTVVRRDWIAWNDTPNHGYWLEFADGRDVCIESYDADDWSHLIRVK
jgi:hypothetical protein